MNEQRWRGFVRHMEPDRGFGGWFVWFFISTVAGIAYQGYWLVRSGGYLHAWSTSQLPQARVVLGIEVVLTFIRIGLFIGRAAGLWLFVNEDRRTPAFWTGYFTAAVPVQLVFRLLGAALASRALDETFATAALANARGTLGPIAVCVVWAFYWRRSRRVRNTYGYAGWRWPPPTEDLQHAHSRVWGSGLRSASMAKRDRRRIFHAQEAPHLARPVLRRRLSGSRCCLATCCVEPAGPVVLRRLGVPRSQTAESICAGT